MSNVHALFQPSTERIELIRSWHQTQAKQADSVATLNVSITADGQIRTQALAIEPEHAVAMLSELKAAVARLERFVGEFAPACVNHADEPLGENVLKFRQPR